VTRDVLIQAAYLVASALFIFGLRGLTSPATARRGMGLAALGMLVAVAGTLLHYGLSYEWIVVGIVIGSLIGAPMAIFMPMTAVPQRTAISHAFGALAVTLVGVSEYYLYSNGLKTVKLNDNVLMAALGFEVMFGSLTITGSLMAFGKLQGLVRSAPMIYPFQNFSNIALFLATFGVFVYLIVQPAADPVFFYTMVGMGVLFGVLFVMPIGGSDMPVVISLLNSYAGLAAAATGFAIGNNVLIIAGALDGASGFFLSILMSKAMNRSFTNVLFGAFGSAQAAGAAAEIGDRTVRPVTVEDVALQLAYARSVIIVPGYGMAVSQAQHQVHQLEELITEKGGEVRYAIHPVAGRMPGHMNVLLAEANVPYDRLKDMEEINSEFERADVALVIGANDVVNPAARNSPSSPIYGMPILNVDQAKSVVVLKRSMNPGFAGIENELFYNPKTSMLFGDAKDSLGKLGAAIKSV
jgi:NAD(P) transhydrogenase subunit beta